MKRLLILFFLITIVFQSIAEKNDKAVYFKISDEINPAAWRTTQQALELYKSSGANTLIIELNTYGGQVDMADSIRTALLKVKGKTIVFINNNAASAGALISIACKKIYMCASASIGAASVVNQTGEVMPEKYQSYMRGIMRATAESNRRDPQIAEGFVDPDVEIPGITEKGKVITFTRKEALNAGFCDAKAESIQEVLTQEEISESNLVSLEETSIDVIINFLINPAVSGVLILLILGGLYFELQSPGIGFPLLVSAIAAVLYFMPLYLEGLAENWEILLFIIGVVLLALEVFVIPGFGIAGILGIVFTFAALMLSLVQNVGFEIDEANGRTLGMAFSIVSISMFISLAGMIALGGRFVKSALFKNIELSDNQERTKGYVANTNLMNLIGKTGETTTVLRPAGKVIIDGKLYDAISKMQFIDAHTQVIVDGESSGNLIVTEVTNT
jgi:membrane-bound serine protease (ClpP class)